MTTEFTVKLPTALVKATDQLVAEGLAPDRDTFVEQAVRHLLEREREAAERSSETPR